MKRKQQGIEDVERGREEGGRFSFEIKIYSLQFLNTQTHEHTHTHTHTKDASIVEKKMVVGRQKSSTGPAENRACK